MAKIMKLWTGLGIAAATSAALAGAAFASDAPQGVIMLAQTTEAAGEGGGEAGGDIPAEYSLSSSDANAYAFDASVQVKAYAQEVLLELSFVLKNRF